MIRYLETIHSRHRKENVTKRESSSINQTSDRKKKLERESKHKINEGKGKKYVNQKYRLNKYVNNENEYTHTNMYKGAYI